MAQNWPGTPLEDDEQIGPHAGRSQSPRAGNAAPPAPANQNAPEQYPGAPVDAPEQPQGQPQPQQPSTDLPYDPLGQGDIGFASGDTLVRSLPPGNDEYTHEVTQGILTGQITSADQLIQIGTKYGVPASSWEPERIKAVNDAIAAVKKGATLGAVGGLEYAAPDVEKLREKDVLSEGWDAAARGAVPFGLGDELGAAVDTVRQGGSFSENLHKNRAIRDYDEEHHFYERLGGEIVGSLALPSGVQETARTAVIDTLKTTLAEELSRGVPLIEAKATAKIAARAAGRRAATQRLAVEGGGYGAGYGAGSSDGNIGDRALAAAGGGATGAVLSATTGALGTKIASLLPKGANAERRAFAQAAKRQDVDFLPADVPGAYGTKVASSVTNSTLGTIPLSEAADKAVLSLKGARDRIAGDIGVVRDDAGAGQAIQRGVHSFLDQSEKRTSELYERIPIAEGMPASLSNSREALADITAGLASNDKLSKLWADDPKLGSTLDALLAKTKQVDTRLLDAAGKPITRAVQEGGTLSWGDIKALRTIIGQKIGQPSLASDGTDIARLRKLYAGLSEDMRATASAQGPEALQAFNRANQYARGRENRISQVFKSLLGNDYQASAESALRNLRQWGNEKGGNFAAVAKLFRSLPDDEANSVRASLFQTMGKAAKGGQDETGTVFSPAAFMTQWNGLSERARRVLLGGEHAQNINDIVTLAAGMKGSSRFANTSKTGLGVGGISTVGGIMSNPVLGTLYIAGQFGAGKLLGSPKFAKWLVGLGKKPNLQALRAHSKRLSVVARAEPAIASDILGLQQRLLETFTGSTPARLAADEAGDGSLGVPEGNSQNAQDYPGEELPQ